jgi:1-acyl-sn-glycerol-3-phosphate acyltransferase
MESIPLTGGSEHSLESSLDCALMNFLKDILARIFALWAMIVFIVSMLILYIPMLLTGLWPEPRRTRAFIALSRVWMKIFFVSTGVRRIFRGKENFAKDENYVVVCNHNTFMDIPLSSPGIPGANKTIARKDLVKVPLFGILYRRGSVLVDRKSEESRRKSFLDMKRVLEMGLHMCIYPEGTRNKTSELLQPFHSGAFRLAVETGKSVIPTVILFTKIVFPRRLFYFWPHRVEMHFLEPVSSVNKSAEELRMEVFEKMHAFLSSKLG